MRAAGILYAFVFSRCSDLNIVVVVPGARCRCCRYTPRSNLQTANANARIPFAVYLATTANPSPQDVACPAEKRTRSRPADIKETFYERELRNDVYTRRLSDFYERKSDIASTLLARYVTAH